MWKYIACSILLLTLNYVNLQTVPPPVDPTSLTPPLGGPPSPPPNTNSSPLSSTDGSVDSIISQLYSQIPAIISACQQLAPDIAKSLSYIPNTSSPMSMIMQYIELIDVQASCDMITKTKQLTDQFQGSGGSGTTGASPTMPNSTTPPPDSTTPPPSTTTPPPPSTTPPPNSSTPPPPSTTPPPPSTTPPPPSTTPPP